MSTFRLATFNCENLFARYRFRQNFDPFQDDNGFTINNLAFDIYNDLEKSVTAKAIKETNADILCLQEVESLPVLDRFKSRYLAKEKYDHRIVVDCFDPRHIDVALLSRYPIKAIRTYRHLRSEQSSASLFSRDCLEIDLDIKGKTFTTYVNHFKSMMGGREDTHDRRLEQAKGVVKIIEDRWGKKLNGAFAVVGDLNDYMEGNSSLTSLVKHEHIANILTALPQQDQWTHYWAGGNEYRQLDYLLLPKSLSEKAGNPVPGLVRKGLPFRATKYSGERFPEVGDDEPKASDHCPLYVDIPLAALE